MSDAARRRSATLKPTAKPARLTNPSTSTSTGGIRAHFARHLLPRHAAFTVTVTIHQLHNVPLVHGEFGLQWKFKGVTGNGILDKVKARKAKSKPCDRTRGPPSITKHSDTDNASLYASDAHSIANSSSPSTNDASPHASAQSMPIPAVVVSVNHSSPPLTARSISGTSSIASASSASSVSSPSNPPGYLSAHWSRHGGRDSELDAALTYSPAKGITPFVKLREHCVIWDQTLKFVVEMSVGRENNELGDCLAKFVIMQRVIAGDPDAPSNPRLGAVYLNLAQYVDAGVITRRYLLRQSKTNATLKLSIHLEHTAGELAYVAPPLPRGEILSGITSFLHSSDVYRTRPRASDLYAHDSSNSDDGGAASGSDTSSVVSGSGASNGVPSQTHGHGHPTVKKHRRPFEVAKLPTINDPRGTEKLIEALFNPVPVTHPDKVTPFTYFVEVDGDGEHGSDSADLAAIGHEDQAPRRNAVEADDDGSLYADSQDEGEVEVEGAKSDYHSLQSHPSVQGSLRSKPSTLSLASKVGSKRDGGGAEVSVPTAVQPHDKATEPRTWWQKVLSPP